jgi:Tfp pilus assembly protein PilX
MSAIRQAKWSRAEGGYALVFALAVMLVLLVVGMRFMAVAHSRHLISDNDKTALQAVLTADAGLQQVVRQLSQDMTWNGSYTDVAFAGGTYSASIAGRGYGYVLVEAEGTYRGVTRRRGTTVYTYSSSGSGLLWAGCYGTGTNQWKNMSNLVDYAWGEQGTYAYHKLGESSNQQSLAGFGRDLYSVPITKVEIVISGYASRTPVNDYLMVRWQLPTMGAAGSWTVWPSSDLAAHVGSAQTGRMYLDVTSNPPPGGWSWTLFYHGTDLELRFASVKVGTDDNVNLYVDCAGFRVTWGS